jgi:hypothetical protein
MSTFETVRNVATEVFDRGHAKLARKCEHVPANPASKYHIPSIPCSECYSLKQALCKLDEALLHLVHRHKTVAKDHMAWMIKDVMTATDLVCTYL